MGTKRKIKKIKKMAYKKKEKIEIEKEQEDSTISKSECEKLILNSSLKPPYQIILDTNFINDCIRKKVDLESSIIDCLNANVDLYIPECVEAELEKLGRVFRLALNMIRKIEIKRLKCQHKGNYADNCILNRIKEHKCFIVATTDVNLRQRIKKLKSVPIIFFRGHKIVSENLY